MLLVLQSVALLVLQSVADIQGRQRTEQSAAADLIRQPANSACVSEHCALWCRLSYAAIDDLMHQGVADMQDRLRTEQLGLQPMAAGGGSYAHYYSHHKTPFTYCYSPHVAPKPKDWGKHIDVVRALCFPGDLRWQAKPELPQDTLHLLLQPPRGPNIEGVGQAHQRGAHTLLSGKP